MEIDSRSYDDNRIRRYATIDARYSQTLKAVATESYIELNTLVDEIDLL